MRANEAAVRFRHANDLTRARACVADRYCKLWDTETGAVISTVTSGKVAYCVTAHPHDDQQNVLLAGQSDKKILQYDWNAGDVVQDVEIEWVRYSDPAVKAFKLNAERNNGRAAMMSILGMMIHEGLTGNPIWPIDYEPGHFPLIPTFAVWPGIFSMGNPYPTP